jgi:subtilisin family serine protease
MGHGTLVTNVAAGSSGVAPDASIGAYRVFGCTGDATDDIIIAAIERAVADGMDIINLSVSDRSGYREVCCATQPVYT